MQKIKKVFILDTNILLSDANAIYQFGNNDIIIPFQVLEEIDKHKKRLDNVGYNGRLFVKLLDDLRKKGSLLNGVRIHKRKGMLFVKDVDTNFKTNLSLSIPDNRILAVAMVEKFNNPNKKIIVITSDINMRLKCDSIGLLSQNYSNTQIISKREHLYSGFIEFTVDDNIIDRFYSGENIFLEEKEIKLYPNQFIMLISNNNEKKSALARFINYLTPLKKIIEYKKGIFGIIPKNKEQTFALNLLMDSNVQVVTLTGVPGGGKTLLTISAALQQVIEEKNTYRKLLICRPMMPVGGKDIGYLPGDKNEKVMNWMSSISDNLEYLLGNDKNMLEEYIDKGIIELEALTFIRGRSISNAIMIIDEAQNLSSHEIKTIITRVGYNTKIILSGDIRQIDAIHIGEFSNGLTYLIERFKGIDIYGHITFRKGERSKVANLGDELL